MQQVECSSLPQCIYQLKPAQHMLLFLGYLQASEAKGLSQRTLYGGQIQLFDVRNRYKALKCLVNTRASITVILYTSKSETYENFLLQADRSSVKSYGMTTMTLFLNNCQYKHKFLKLILTSHCMVMTSLSITTS